MQKRTAEVMNIHVNSVTFSSIFGIGDTVSTNQKSNGIAVQKEGAIFTKEENLHFQDYPIFKREANWLKQKSNTAIEITKHKDAIYVQNSQVIGVSSSSVFQVGCIDKITADSRIKHFRKLRS